MVFIAKLWRAVRQPRLLVGYILQKSDDYILTRLWLFVSWAVRLYLAKAGPKVWSTVCNKSISTVYFKSPEIGTNYILSFRGQSLSYAKKQSKYIGPNLSDIAKRWLEEVLDARVNECNHALGLKMVQGDLSIFATFASRTPAGPIKIIYFARILTLALHLRKQGIPAVIFLPDTFYPDAAIVASLLAGLTQGATVFLQNSKAEADHFGYPNPIGPIFWTWPPSRAGTKTTTTSWIDRRDSYLVPAGNTGGTSRLLLAKRFLEHMSSANGYTALITDGSLSNEEYNSALRLCKLSMTTNYVQDNFFVGPKSYRERISATTTTGRVWEAFARGQVLICNETQVLKDLGFVAGVHYLELRSVLNSSSPLLGLTDSQLQQMAELGQSLFLDLTQRSKTLKLTFAPTQE